MSQFIDGLLFKNPRVGWFDFGLGPLRFCTVILSFSLADGVGSLVVCFLWWALKLSWRSGYSWRLNAHCLIKGKGSRGRLLRFSYHRRICVRRFCTGSWTAWRRRNHRRRRRRRKNRSPGWRCGVSWGSTSWGCCSGVWSRGHRRLPASCSASLTRWRYVHGRGLRVCWFIGNRGNKREMCSSYPNMCNLWSSYFPNFYKKGYIY